jgi:septal ring factor EnvC (AmiA/AmiB activator)
MPGRACLESKGGCVARMSSTRTELQAQRRLIEQQQVQIQRLLRQVEVQMRFAAHLEDEINNIHAARQPAPRSIQDVPLNGNGQRDPRHPSNFPISRRNEQT